MNDKKTSNNKKSFAFLEDESININHTPANIKEVIQNSRSKETNKNKEDITKNIKKGGRPKIKEEDKKQMGVWVYLSKAQKQELQEKAKKANLSLSKYISIKLFGIE